MRKFLVTLCSVALIAGTISPMPVMAAAGDEVYDFDGDIIDNPWGEEFTTVAELKILTTLKDVEVAAGDKVTLTVKAEGTNLTYQWEISTDNGATWKATTASGAKTATVSFAMTAAMDGRLIRCVVTDGSSNSATTNAAKLSVKSEVVTPPVEQTSTLKLLVQPCDVVSESGKPVQISTYAKSTTGSAVSYQWQISTDGGKTWKNSSSSGSKTSQIMFSMSKNLGGRYARCVITDADGNTVTTRSALITLGKPVEMKLVEQPEAIYAQVGEYGYSTLEATGNGVTYRWQISTDGGKTWKNSTSTGFNTNTLSFKMNKTYDGRYARCIITDANMNTITTKAVKIGLGIGTAYILTQPENVAGSAGDTIAIQTIVAGSNLTYQWEISTDGGKTWKKSSAAGAKTGMMQFVMSKNLDGRYARCVITDGSGNTVTTNSVSISLK